PVPEPGLAGGRGGHVRGLFPDGPDRGALAAAGTLRTGGGRARRRVRPGGTAADCPGTASVRGPHLRRDRRRDGDEPEGGQESAVPGTQPAAFQFEQVHGTLKLVGCVKRSADAPVPLGTSALRLTHPTPVPFSSAAS